MFIYVSLWIIAGLIGMTLIVRDHLIKSEAFAVPSPVQRRFHYRPELHFAPFV